MMRDVTFSSNSSCSRSIGLTADAPAQMPVAVALLREGVPADLARVLPTPEVSPQVVLQIGYLYEQFLADPACVVRVCAARHLVHLGVRVPQFDILVDGQPQFGTVALLSTVI